MICNKPRDAAVFGIDIGKNIFHVVGIDSAGQPIQPVRFRRNTLLQFFERAKPALVGMEACPGSEWLARKIRAPGHTVRIIPAQFVKYLALLGISKRGNGHVRRLFIHDARSCVLHLDRKRSKLGAWIDALQSRMHINKVVVALANKIARIAWVRIKSSRNPLRMR
jgi:transposase